MRSAFAFQGDSLHLTLLDESGHSHDPSSDFFVLAGISIFERQNALAGSTDRSCSGALQLDQSRE